MKRPTVTTEQQDFIRANSSTLSVIEIAERLKLNRSKVYNNIYALGVSPKEAKVQNEPAQNGMFDYTQHENWLV
jgi:hypothetical protein